MSIPATLTKLETSQGSTSRIDSRRFKVAASTTIKKGDFVKLDSSGNLVQYIGLPATGSAITAVAGAGSVLGKAVEDITTDANGISTSTSGAAFGKTDIEVELASPMSTFSLRIISRATAVVVDTVYTPVAANSNMTNAPGVMETGLNPYRLVRYALSTTDWFYGVCDLTTNGEFNIVELVPSQLVTTEYQLVRGRINAASRQGLF